jgi:hypothetical protein
MFGIEIDNALLIEISLNALGYVAAGGLTVMLYSSLTKRRWRRMFAEIIEQSAEIVAINNAANSAASAAKAAKVPPASESSDIGRQRDIGFEEHSSTVDGSSRGFVSFAPPNRMQQERPGLNATTGSRLEVDDAVSEYHSAQPQDTRGATGDYTRNRSNVIRLAKEMLESGRSSESVRSELPITDTEMRLVEIGSRR